MTVYEKGDIKVGSLIFCPICGNRTEVTMSYREHTRALDTKHHRFHCSFCGSNVEFSLIWDLDIDKLYR